jgi:hypothetical protein
MHLHDAVGGFSTIEIVDMIENLFDIDLGGVEVGGDAEKE